MKTIVEFPDRRIVAEEAAQWLIRLDGDIPPTRQELQALGEWLSRSPAHREELDNLTVLWGRMNVLTRLAVPLKNASREPARPWFGRGVSSYGSLWRHPGLIAAAAALALVLIFGWMLSARQPVGGLSANGWYATAVGQQKTATLADNSRVILNTNSQIKVDYGGGYRRVYLLRGEAAFTVAKDAGRPFRVYAGKGRIEAVGTAFSVYLDGAHVNVAVTEGRVALAYVNRPRTKAPADTDDGLMESLGTLDAGHVAKLRSSVGALEAGVSTLETIQPIGAKELAQRLAWREGTLIFSGETLEQVVREFARYTTVSIEIPDEAVRNMRIGGRFPAGETDAMLAVLQTNFNLRVTRLGPHRVVISRIPQK